MGKGGKRGMMRGRKVVEFLDGQLCVMGFYSVDFGSPT